MRWTNSIAQTVWDNMLFFCNGILYTEGSVTICKTTSNQDISKYHSIWLLVEGLIRVLDSARINHSPVLVNYWGLEAEGLRSYTSRTPFNTRPYDQLASFSDDFYFPSDDTQITIRKTLKRHLYGPRGQSDPFDRYSRAAKLSEKDQTCWAVVGEVGGFVG